MRKEKFKIGDAVKCPEGIYNISYFLRVTSNTDFLGNIIKIKEIYFEEGFEIMIKGVGIYTEDQVELMPTEEEWLQNEAENIIFNKIDYETNKDGLFCMFNEIIKAIKLGYGLKKPQINAPYHYDTGWDCISSPNGTCNYEQEDGSFDEDSCKYCGQPEERK